MPNFKSIFPFENVVVLSEFNTVLFKLSIYENDSFQFYKKMYYCNHNSLFDLHCHVN